MEDTAWHPVTDEALAGWNETTKALFKIFLGTPLKLWASVGHWALWHFDLSKYKPKEHPRVRACVRACAALCRAWGVGRAAGVHAKDCRALWRTRRGRAATRAPP